MGIKEELLGRLREAVDSSDVIFPGKMDISGDAEYPTLSLGKSALVGNMQDDASAFEGFSIALLEFASCRQIRLRWELPAQDDRKAYEHYQRFLHRVAFFRGLFPELTLDEEQLDAVNERLAKPGACYVNVPDQKAQEGADKPEARLERELVDAMRKTYPGDWIDQQFPCGVFTSPDPKPKKVNRILPGGNAAMDIVRVSKDGRTVFVYELKEKKNSKIGMVGELLFYASMLRDLVCGGMKFVEYSRPLPRCGEIIDALRSAERPDGIEAVFLVEEGNFHPLLMPGFLRRLNAAAARMTGPALCFKKARFTAGADGRCSVPEYVP